MKHLKTFENIHKIIPKDVMGNLHANYDDYPIVKNLYDIDVIEYFKEILLDKNVTFKSVNKPERNPYLTGVVVDVDAFVYQDEVFITVKLNNKKNNWNIVNMINNITIQDYDADDKPIHKKVKMKKETDKYNL